MSIPVRGATRDVLAARSSPTRQAPRPAASSASGCCVLKIVRRRPHGALRRRAGRRGLRVKCGRLPRILFVRPDHVGDVLLTLPAVAALRRTLPGAYLAYAAAPAAAGIAQRCPNLDETVTVR